MDPFVDVDTLNLLQSMGTDVAMNEADPMGDGDQSPLNNVDDLAFFLANTLCIPGIDELQTIRFNSLSSFSGLCVMGKVGQVERALRGVCQPDSPSIPVELVQLLESRETTNLYSPLLRIAVIMATSSHSFTEERRENLLEVAKVLLRYGARPDAKQAHGMTVCHLALTLPSYDGDVCVQVPSNESSFALVNMCAAAAESSHLFGKQVVLFGLQNEALNGAVGLARGFNVDTGRREVYLLSGPSSNRSMAVKPENLRLLEDEDSGEPAQCRPKFCDIQDRFGDVCLGRLCMSDRIEAAKFLLERHHARTEISDWTGLSPLTYGDILPELRELLKAHYGKQVKADMIAEKRRCTHCGVSEKQEERMLLCLRCKSVRYCSRECQEMHWKEEHKRKCRTLDAQRHKGIVLETMEPAAASFVPDVEWSFRRPDQVAVDEKFFVKVIATEGIEGQPPLAIADQTHAVYIDYPPGRPGFAEMFNTVKTNDLAATEYRYMKASFDSDGNCTVYPGTVTMKSW